MEHVSGSLGTITSFALRLGQLFFSSASLIFMCLVNHFHNMTIFRSFTIVMSYVIPWSISLALADAYSVLLTQLPHEPIAISLVIAGDVVMSFFSLAGACGVASAIEMLLSIGASECGDNLCSQYKISAALAVLCWLLLLASALFNLWRLPSLFHRQDLFI